MVDRDLTSSGALFYSKSTDRFLFLLRTKSNSDTWGIPGGKCFSYESPLKGLRREIQEEIGLDTTEHKFIPLETYTNGHFEYHTFICVTENEFVPKLNEEHSGYCWCHIKSYPKPLHPGVWSSWSNIAIQDKIKTLVSALKITQ